MDNVDRRRERREEDQTPWWAVGLGIAAGAAAVAGGIYMLSKATSKQSSTDSDSEDSDEKMEAIAESVSRLNLSSTPKVSNLNSLLHDIYVRYVAIDKNDLENHYNVFNQVFYKLHENMKLVDPYYERYSSRAQFAGSHYDRMRIEKPDEFDMDIVIGLPVNIDENSRNPEESDIIIEQKHPGFVQLRAGPQYLKLPERDDFHINKQAYLWLDERKYIQRSRFTQWFKSVVNKALNKFERLNGFPCITIGGTVYKIGNSESGPAYTLIITNSSGFKLDVDLVPAFKFPERRWLGKIKAYSDIPPGCSVGFWMVVPKPNKQGATSHDGDRSWRVAMHDQEKRLFHNSYHFRQANRLLKKLRNAQKMDYIASYHIKTLFLWKAFKVNDPTFWRQDIATLFKIMLREFHQALVEKKINYFWNKRQNMIENVPEHILKGYATKLATLIAKLEDDKNYMWAAKYLLTNSEYAEYERAMPNKL